MEEKLVHEYKKIENQINFKYISNKIRIRKNKNLRKWIYYFKVWEFTEMNLVHINDSYKRSSLYHTDHIISIHIGYENGIMPNIIGGVDNLQIITQKENFEKGTSLTLKSIELIKKYGLHIYSRGEKVKKNKATTKYEKQSIGKTYDSAPKKLELIYKSKTNHTPENDNLKKIISFIYSDGFSLC